MRVFHRHKISPVRLTGESKVNFIGRDVPPLVGRTGNGHNSRALRNLHEYVTGMLRSSEDSPFAGLQLCCVHGP